jgi:hypothetical protein
MRAAVRELRPALPIRSIAHTVTLMTEQPDGNWVRSVAFPRRPRRTRPPHRSRAARAVPLAPAQPLTREQRYELARRMAAGYRRARPRGERRPPKRVRGHGENVGPLSEVRAMVVAGWVRSRSRRAGARRWGGMGKPVGFRSLGVVARSEVADERVCEQAGSAVCSHSDARHGPRRCGVEDGRPAGNAVAAAQQLCPSEYHRDLPDSTRRLSCLRRLSTS